jgi:hypothetical protein
VNELIDLGTQGANLVPGGAKIVTHFDDVRGDFAIDFGLKQSMLTDGVTELVDRRVFDGVRRPGLKVFCGDHATRIVDYRLFHSDTSLAFRF